MAMAWLQFLQLCILHCVYLCAQGVAPNVNTTSSVINQVATGSNIQLKCKSNNSSVMFAWYFNSSPVKTNMRVSITAGELSSTLRLNNVAQDDSGWYTCRGANANGYNYRDFLVAVGNPPMIRPEDQPASVNTTENITVPFACLANGIPSPLIQWYRSDQAGQEVPTCGSSSGDVCVDDTADFQLLVRATSKTANIDYHCSGTNEFGSVQSNRARINLLPDPPESMPPPPSALMPFYRTSVDDTLRLECFGSGAASPPEVSWKRNGMTLDGETRRTLSVQGADTRGVYCCLLSPPGNPVNLSYCTYILPQSNPDIVVQPPSLITVETGRSIGLVCIADGVIGPQVDWMRGENTLQSDSEGRYNITENRMNCRLSYFLLASVEATDAGMYKCRAFNFIHNDTESFEISVVSPTSEHNLLSDAGAEIGGMESPWEYKHRQGTAQKAMRKNVNGEYVFEIGYTETMPIDDLYIRQSFVIPANVTQVRVSARMRQSSTTSVAAYPLLTLQVGDNTTDMMYSMDWMEPNGSAWQWASMDVTISAAQMARNASVIMNVTINSGSPPNGVVYFDDVSVAPIAFESPTVATDTLIIIVAASAAGGGVLLLAVVAVFLVVCCCCCYYCGCCKRRNDAEPMRKESAKKRFAKLTTRYYPNRPSIDDAVVLQDSQNYTVLLDTVPENQYTRPGKDPLYSSVRREENNVGINNPITGEGKDYYYIKQPASVPERKASASVTSSSFLGPPASGRAKSASQSSLASRELPALPDVDVTDLPSPEPTNQYLKLLPAAALSAAGEQEAVDSYENASLQYPKKDSSSKEPLTEGQDTYANEELGPQKGHRAVDRQPTYDYPEPDPGSAKHPRPPLLQQPSAEYEAMTA